MGKTKFEVNKATKSIVMEHVFDAPRSQVWQAWTNADELVKWWGPRGWETTIKKFEFKPGGVWYYMMKCVDKAQGEYFGMKSRGIGTFKESHQKSASPTKTHLQTKPARLTTTCQLLR